MTHWEVGQDRWAYLEPRAFVFARGGNNASSSPIESSQTRVVVRAKGAHFSLELKYYILERENRQFRSDLVQHGQWFIHQENLTASSLRQTQRTMEKVTLPWTGWSLFEATERSWERVSQSACVDIWRLIKKTLRDLYLQALRTL